MTYSEFFIRIALCFALGGAIGFERQWKQRLAGIKTNVLVSLGAFLFVTMSMVLRDQSVTRIAAQVVSGIGFLGAGVIMRDGRTVKGLNTAATLWCSAAIGTLTSAGFIVEAVGGTAVIILANVSLRIFANKLPNSSNHYDENEYVYQLKVTCKEKSEPHVRILLMHMIHTENILLKKLESNDSDETPNALPLSANKLIVIVKVMSNKRNHETLEKIASRMSLEDGITSVSWEMVH